MLFFFLSFFSRDLDSVDDVDVIIFSLAFFLLLLLHCEIGIIKRVAQIFIELFSSSLKLVPAKAFIKVGVQSSSDEFSFSLKLIIQFNLRPPNRLTTRSTRLRKHLLFRPI